MNQSLEGTWGTKPPLEGTMSTRPSSATPSGRDGSRPGSPASRSVTPAAGTVALSQRAQRRLSGIVNVPVHLRHHQAARRRSSTKTPPSLDDAVTPRRKVEFTPAERKQIVDAFSRAGLLVEVNAIARLLGKLGQTMSEADVSELLAQCRWQPGSSLPLDTFCEMMLERKRQHLLMSSDEDPEALDAFVALGGSADKHGNISTALVKDAVKNFHLDSDVDEILTAADTDGSGSVSFEEFRVMFRRMGGGTDKTMAHSSLGMIPLDTTFEEDCYAMPLSTLEMTRSMEITSKVRSELKVNQSSAGMGQHDKLSLKTVAGKVAKISATMSPRAARSGGEDSPRGQLSPRSLASPRSFRTTVLSQRIDRSVRNHDKRVASAMSPGLERLLDGKKDPRWTIMQPSGEVTEQRMNETFKFPLPAQKLGKPPAMVAREEAKSRALAIRYGDEIEAKLHHYATEESTRYARNRQLMLETRATASPLTVSYMSSTKHRVNNENQLVECIARANSVVGDARDHPNETKLSLERIERKESAGVKAMLQANERARKQELMTKEHIRRRQMQKKRSMRKQRSTLGASTMSGTGRPPASPIAMASPVGQRVGTKPKLSPRTSPRRRESSPRSPSSPDGKLAGLGSRQYSDGSSGGYGSDSSSFASASSSSSSWEPYNSSQPSTAEPSPAKHDPTERGLPPKVAHAPAPVSTSPPPPPPPTLNHEDEQQKKSPVPQVAGKAAPMDSSAAVLSVASQSQALALAPVPRTFEVVIFCDNRQPIRRTLKHMLSLPHMVKAIETELQPLPPGAFVSDVWYEPADVCGAFMPVPSLEDLPDRVRLKAMLTMSKPKGKPISSMLAKAKVKRTW